MTRLGTLTGAIVLASAGLALAQAGRAPARFLDGAIPVMPPLAVSGGEVMLSVSVSSTGAVGAVDVLRTTPPFTDPIVEAVRTWRFSPALDDKRKPIDAHVLVGVVIRAPSLNVPTLGTPPKTVSTDDTRVPFPAQTSVPNYPVNARSEGSVLVEASVDRSGHVATASAVRSSPPFDSPALETARSWTFRPAEGGAAPPSTFAYLLFVFRQPLVGASPPLEPPKPTPPPSPKK